MEPKGVRMACPDCQWNCVMKNEQDVPSGVTKTVEGVPYCPNCNIAMKPVASVDLTARPERVIVPMTLSDIASKVAEIEKEAAAAEKDLKRAADEHKETRKIYDGKVTTLRMVVQRMARVLAGEAVEADLPLLAIAEQAPGSEAVRLATDELRQRLGSWYVVVDNATIEGWSLEQYDVVISYLTKLETHPQGEAIDLLTPDFLPPGIPDHIQALHSVLGQVGVPVTLDQLCALDDTQRGQARAWAVAYTDGTETLESKPAFLPDIVEEVARVTSRRYKRGQKPVRKSATTTTEPDDEPEPEPAHA